MPPINPPHNALSDHVTGAIQRGDADPITEKPAPSVSDARQAVQMFWSHRSCLPDSDSVNEAIELIRDTSRTAKAQSRRITEDEWFSMAEMVDDACVDECLPRLFEIEA